jgi:hypothetical protein
MTFEDALTVAGSGETTEFVSNEEMATLKRNT